MSGVVCFCINCSDNDEKENSTCILKPGAQCFASAEEKYNPETRTLELVYSAGCLPPEEQSLLQCKGDLVPHYYYRTIKCCNFTDYCNKNLLPPYKPRDILDPPDFSIENVYLAPVIVSFAFCFVIFFLCVVFLYCKYKKSNGSRKCFTGLYSVKVQKRINYLHDSLHSSGSGTGKPLLVRRTIGREVKKERLLGKGRFGEKWVVIRNEEFIVMKIFSTLEEEQYMREKKIYQTGICHANILGLIGADILQDTSRAIFTRYLENGSLYDYLKERCLNDKDLLTLAQSAAKVMTCLHIEILATYNRPVIVHRNITSKNFLINDMGECVICDFENALTSNDNLDSKVDTRVGTPRYMAPEIVNETINVQSFEAFKMADIYSLGLVLWEMCRRYATIAEDYALPFSNILPDYPTVGDMKDLFATKKPVHEILGIPVTWEKDRISNVVISLVRECISENAKARPTALRISKRLSELENIN